MLELFGSSQLLAEFSRRTGIRDGVVEQLVADMSNPMRFMGQMTTTTAQPVTTTANALTMDDIKQHLDIIGRSSMPISPFKDGGPTYNRINFNFGKKPFRFSDIPPEQLVNFWKPTMLNRDETDWREMYERELELRDLLEKDGWIPRED